MVHNQSAAVPEPAAAPTAAGARGTEQRGGGIAELFRQVGNQFKAEIADRAATWGMSLQQIRVLAGIEGPTTMSQVAKDLGVELSNLTPVMDRLESAGLVQRRLSARDRRVREILLTPAGRAAKGRVISADRTPMRMFACLTDAEQSELSRLLTKLVAAGQANFGADKTQVRDLS